MPGADMLRRLRRGLDWCENAILVVGLAVASCVIFLQVILRYGFNQGLPWAEELAVYATIWLTFVAAGAALRKHLHLTVNVRGLVIQGRALVLVALLTNLIGAAFGLALLWLGIDLVRRTAALGQMSAALQIPMWIIYIAVPLSGFLMAVRFGERILHGYDPAEDAPEELREAQSGRLE